MTRLGFAVFEARKVEVIAVQYEESFREELRLIGCQVVDKDVSYV